MEQARLDASSGPLCRTTAHIALCVVVLGATGCTRLPRLYETMTLGEPLDRSVLPRGVYVTEDPEAKTIPWTEHRQLFLPVGTLRCALEIQQNPEGEVTSVRLEEYHVSYWVGMVREA